ncbi:MAG: membrane dipeptidase [Steroidobacteraceae bacterium]
MSTITRRTLLGGAVTAGAVMGLTSALATAAGATGGASRPLVVDGLDCSSVSEKFLDLMRQGGANCVHLTVGRLAEENGGSPGFGTLYEFADKHGAQMVIARSVRDIRDAAQAGKIAFVLGWQDANILDGPLRESRVFTTMNEDLRAYTQLGLRVIGICFNNSNLFGGGCLEQREPLTQAGRRLVEEVHKRNLLLDVGGHTGEQTSLDAIEVSKGVPVVSTHTNAAAINPNMRCISDRLAVAIANTGGVIGINALCDFHNRNAKSALIHGDRSPQVSLDKHLDQYDYFKKLVGVEHIGLGPDFEFGTNWSVQGSRPPMCRLIGPTGNRAPAGSSTSRTTRTSRSSRT